MKIYISADMEGIAGVVDWYEVEASHRDYAWSQKQMTKEVQVVCETAFELGVESVMVKDAHDSGRNINISDLPHGTLIHRAWTGDPLVMMSGIENGYDAVVFTGYHSGAYSDGSPLAHTMNSTTIKWIKMNGMYMSEFMMNAYTAAYYNVPVIAITGDQSICEEAKALIPEITTIAVKSCSGNACTTMSSNDALIAIEEGCRHAIRKYSHAKSACALKLPEQMKFEINFSNAGLANKASHYPGVKRLDSCTVQYDTGDYYEFLRMFFFAC